MVYADNTWECKVTSSFSPGECDLICLVGFDETGAEDLPPSASGEIEAYMDREATLTVPWRSTNYSTGRPLFTKILDDPDYIKATGGELKDFQLTGLNWLAYLWSRGENGILADEVRPVPPVVFKFRSNERIDVDTFSLSFF